MLATSGSLTCIVLLSITIKIVMSYAESEIASLTIAMTGSDKSATTVNENNLRMFWWDEDNRVWILAGNSTVDTTNNTVTGYHNRAGIYRIMGYSVSSIGTGEKVFNVSNYPNPFKATEGKKTKIRYYLSYDNDVKIHIYDLVGGLVWEKEIKKGEIPGGIRGPNEIEWNGKNKDDVIVNIGGYICVIMCEGDKKIVNIGVK